MPVQVSCRGTVGSVVVSFGPFRLRILFHRRQICSVNNGIIGSQVWTGLAETNTR